MGASTNVEMPPTWAPVASKSVEMPPPPVASSKVGMPPPPVASSKVEMPPPPVASSKVEMPPPPAASNEVERPPPPVASSNVEMPPTWAPVASKNVGMPPTWAPVASKNVEMPPTWAPVASNNVEMPPTWAPGVVVPQLQQASSSEVQGGRCINERDQKLWRSGGRGSFDAQLGGCGRQCGAGYPCTKSCMQRKGYSSGCAGCMAKLVGCSRDNCLNPCVKDQHGSLCTGCVKNHCRGAMAGCSGWNVGGQ